MSTRPLTICLPIADRPRSFDFYRGGLGFEAVGALVEDGVPEPVVTAESEPQR
jgi:catechol 2,3-dioxygenase-like lactoylglutathione lyase family enzyme